MEPEARRTLSDAERGKLSRILGMMGSEHDGEALAAARMAERIRKACGLTWEQVLLPPPTKRRRQVPDPLAEWGGWWVAAQWCLDSGMLEPWERSFFLMLDRRRVFALNRNDRAVVARVLRDTQRRVLEDCKRRLRARAA